MKPRLGRPKTDFYIPHQKTAEQIGLPFALACPPGTVGFPNVPWV